MKNKQKKKKNFKKLAKKKHGESENIICEVKMKNVMQRKKQTKREKNRNLEGKKNKIRKKRIKKSHERKWKPNN